MQWPVPSYMSEDSCGLESCVVAALMAGKRDLCEGVAGDAVPLAG